MIDLSLLIDQYGGFVASMAVIAVAISKAGFGGAMASLSAPIMLLAFTHHNLCVLLPLLVADIWVVWFWHLGVRRIIIVMTVTALFGHTGWFMLHYGALDDRG